MRAKVGEIRAFLNQVGEEDDEMEMASDGESEASGDEEVAAQGAIVPAPSEAAPAAAPVAAPAAAPAAAPPPAPVEVTATAVLDDPQTKTAYQRSLGKVNKQLALSNTECTRLKQANATLAHALRQRGIELPEGALYVSGTHDTHVPDATAGAGTGVPIAPPVVNTALAPGDFSFGMRMLHLPDTSTILQPKRFSIGAIRWPPLMDIYKQRRDFAPHTEKRAKQYLQFGLYDRRDSERKVTEHELKNEHGAVPTVNFKLFLVYDDNTDEVVTIDGLSECKRDQLASISEPNILGVLEAPLAHGKVTFKLRNLNVMSTQTEPAGRKFVYKLVCTHAEFKDKLYAMSPAFYNVSKSKVPQLEARPTRAAASTAVTVAAQ